MIIDHKEGLSSQPRSGADAETSHFPDRIRHSHAICGRVPRPVNGGRVGSDRPK